jgi:hypothetical protein
MTRNPKRKIDKRKKLTLIEQQSVRGYIVAKLQQLVRGKATSADMLLLEPESVEHYKQFQYYTNAVKACEWMLTDIHHYFIDPFWDQTH